MIDWTRTSIRNLVYQLRYSEDELTETAAYSALVNELSRYFHGAVNANGWYFIVNHKEEVIHNAILKLIYVEDTEYREKNPLRINSWQYKKYIYRTMLTVCGRFLNKLGNWDSIDTTIHGREDHVIADLLAYETHATQFAEVSDSFIELAPEQIFSRDEQAKILQTAVSRLSQRDQQLIQLADVESLSHKEVANQLEMSHGNVRTSLNRARTRYLRQILNCMVERDLELPKEHVLETIQQLPTEEQTLLQAWWNGTTSWNKLGKLLTPTRSQSETQEIFAQGVARLFHLIQIYEVNP